MKDEQTDIPDGHIKRLVPFNKARRRPGFSPQVKLSLVGGMDSATCRVCKRTSPIVPAFDKTRMDAAAEFAQAHYESCFPVFDIVLDPKKRSVYATV